MTNNQRQKLVSCLLEAINVNRDGKGYRFKIVGYYYYFTAEILFNLDDNLAGDDLGSPITRDYLDRGLLQIAKRHHRRIGRLLNEIKKEGSSE